MLKTIAWVFWLVVFAILVTLGLANRDLVTLRALPEGLGNLFGFGATVQVPLFLVIFLAVGLGLLIGFLWEWLREAPIRAEARRQGKEVAALSQKMGRARGDQDGKGAEILALLDRPKAP